MKTISHYVLLILVIQLLSPMQTALAQREGGEYNEVAFFDFSQTMRQSYQHALHLRFKDCKLILQNEKAKNPFNLMPYYIDDYVDFFKMYINEHHAEFERLLPQREVRIAKLRTGDESSPYYLYTQAAVRVHWAFIHFKFLEYGEVNKELKKALDLLLMNQKLFPDFVANKKLLGVLHTLAGAIPNTNIPGSSISTGLRELHEVISYGKRYPKFEFNEETQILYGMLLMELNVEENDWWDDMNLPLLDYRKSPMAAFIQAGMYLEEGNGSKALAVLDASPPTTDDNFHAFYLLDYMKGLCHLYKLDNAKAEGYIKKYLDKYSGVHWIKDAYQKMAWCFFLKKDMGQFGTYINYAKEKGNTASYADAKTYYDITVAGTPNLQLLRSQLLFEGGFFDKSLVELNNCPVASLKTEREKIEHTFRKARIMHRMKKFDDALPLYDQTMTACKGKNYYFGAAASLYAGLIWEERGDYEKARNFYTNCLKQNPEVHKKNIQDRARTRLDYIKNLKNSALTKTGTVLAPR